MKNLQYTTIANDKHSIQVSTWVERDDDGHEEWHYKFMVNGEVTSQGLLGDVNGDADEVAEAEVATTDGD